MKLKRSTDNRKWVTIGQKSCQLGKGLAYCCNKDVDVSSCYWNTGTYDLLKTPCSGSNTCPSGSRIDSSKRGGANGNGKGKTIQECQNTQQFPQPGNGGSNYNDLAWCCDTTKMVDSVSIHCIRHNCR
jgi:chitinase